MKIQHKATLSINGRNVDIHAPPYVPEDKLDSWLAETLKSEGVTLVSKTWAPLGAIESERPLSPTLGEAEQLRSGQRSEAVMKESSR